MATISKGSRKDFIRKQSNVPGRFFDASFAVRKSRVNWVYMVKIG